MRTRRIYKNRDARIRASGLAESYKDYLKSDEWKEIRSKVLQRDRNSCRTCRREATQVHHTNYATNTLLGHGENPITGAFAICGACHKFIEYNADGTKAHLFKEVRKRIVLLAKLNGVDFVFPGDERRGCRLCKRDVPLGCLDSNSTCRRCKNRIAKHGSITKSPKGKTATNQTPKNIKPASERAARKANADAIEGDIRKAASNLGIALVVTSPQIRWKRKAKSTRHWMFNDETTGLRMLDYWPSSGKYIDFEKRLGTVSDPWEALEQARRWVTPSGER